MNATNVPVARRATEPQIDTVTSISLVVAMYRVEPYLPEFLESIENQDLGGIELECIFVDDGSPMNEAEIAESWLSRTGISGRVIRKANGGVSSARNAGIEQATGDWVSFPDPDDMLSPGYFRAVVNFISTPAGAKADVIAAKLCFYFEESDEVRNSHPLTFKFDGRAQNLSLRRMPHVMQMHIASTFIRRSVFSGTGLRFDERLRIAEDAVLLARAFGSSEFPLLGVVPEAEYRYRKRAAKDSALDVTGQDPAARVETLEFGHLPLLCDLYREGNLHEWVGHMVLYELGWLYRQESSSRPFSARMTSDQRQHLLTLTGKVLALLEPEWIHTFLRPKVSAEVKLLWEELRRIALRDPRESVLSEVCVTSLDAPGRLVQLSYYCTDARVNEAVRVGGRVVVPVASKLRAVKLFEQQLVFERLVWVPATSWLRVELNGRLHPIYYGRRSPNFSVLRAEYWKKFGESYDPRTVSLSAVNSRERRRKRPKRSAWRRPGGPMGERLLSKEEVRKAAERGRKSQAGAWLFMDRLNLAGDNAEHLYRHVRRKHPTIRSWFVLERNSPDWARLKRDGFRLVAYRSRLHQALLLNAHHVISSHIDIEMTAPIPHSYYPKGRRPWFFTFLQHGVTKDDLSRWLNTKDIRTFVTSTKSEYESIVGDATSYKFTEREALLSEFPRHDVLRDKALRRSSRVSEVRVLLIAPTWRNGLFTPKRSFRSRELIEGFESTDYVSQWKRLLNSEKLRKCVRDQNLKVVFLPHPGMEPYVKHFSVPDWMETRFYSAGDIQDTFVEANVLVTDYSSSAFDLAYIDTPTVYFQFDRKDIYGGIHIYAPGYFDYDEHGFGPVCESADAVVSAVGGLLAVRAEFGTWPEPYQARIDETFPFKDGRASERVTQAILASRPDVSYDSRERAPLTLRRVARGIARRLRKLARRAG